MGRAVAPVAGRGCIRRESAWFRGPVVGGHCAAPWGWGCVVSGSPLAGRGCGDKNMRRGASRCRGTARQSLVLTRSQRHIRRFMSPFFVMDEAGARWSRMVDLCNSRGEEPACVSRLIVMVESGVVRPVIAQ